MRTRRRWLTSVLLAAGVLVTLPLPSLAQDATPPAGVTAQVQMSVRGDGQTDGARIVAEITPGESKDVTIWIGNYGAENLPVVAFTSDISTKINGGLDMDDEGSEQHPPTTWVDFPTQEYDIAPQKEMSRTFTVSVPADAAPGEYVVPLAVETINSYEVPGAGQIRQKIRKVLTLYIVVPGDYKAAFSLGEPTVEFVTGGAAIQVPIDNEAQTTIRLAGEIVVKDDGGGTVVDAPINLAAIYGMDDTSLLYRLESLPPPGDYLISVTLTDGVSGVSASFENKTLVVPEPPSNEVVPLAFGNIAIGPNAEPIQYAGVIVEMINNGEVIRSTRLTLIVTKDGQPLEAFVLADNFTLNQGTTTATQRYLPLNGWESGSYGFSLKLESVDPSTGGTTLLLSQNDVATIKVP